MGNIGIWQLLIVAVIIVLLFGTKKLRNLGSDIGSSVKGFKKAMNPEEETEEQKKSLTDQEKNVANNESDTVQTKEKDQA